MLMIFAVCCATEAIAKDRSEKFRPELFRTGMRKGKELHSSVKSSSAEAFIGDTVN